MLYNEPHDLPTGGHIDTLRIVNVVVSVTSCSYCRLLQKDIFHLNFIPAAYHVATTKPHNQDAFKGQISDVLKKLGIDQGSMRMVKNEDCKDTL